MGDEERRRQAENMWQGLAGNMARSWGGVRQQQQEPERIVDPYLSGTTAKTRYNPPGGQWFGRPTQLSQNALQGDTRPGYGNWRLPQTATGRGTMTSGYDYSPQVYQTRSALNRMGIRPRLGQGGGTFGMNDIQTLDQAYDAAYNAQAQQSQMEQANAAEEARLASTAFQAPESTMLQGDQGMGYTGMPQYQDTQTGYDMGEYGGGGPGSLPTYNFGEAPDYAQEIVDKYGELSASPEEADALKKYEEELASYGQGLNQPDTNTANWMNRFQSSYDTLSNQMSPEQSLADRQRYMELNASPLYASAEQRKRNLQREAARLGYYSPALQDQLQGIDRDTQRTAGQLGMQYDLGQQDRFDSLRNQRANMAMAGAQFGQGQSQADRMARAEWLRSMLDLSGEKGQLWREPMQRGLSMLDLQRWIDEQNGGLY